MWSNPNLQWNFINWVFNIHSHNLEEVVWLIWILLQRDLWQYLKFETNDVDDVKFRFSLQSFQYISKCTCQLFLFFISTTQLYVFDLFALLGPLAPFSLKRPYSFPEKKGQFCPIAHHVNLLPGEITSIKILISHNISRTLNIIRNESTD